MLLDGKLVELGQWRRCADVFIGADQPGAIAVLQRLQRMVDNRSAYLLELERRKVTADGQTFGVYVVAIDEIAYFSATVGKTGRSGAVRRAAARSGRAGAGRSA